MNSTSYYFLRPVFLPLNSCRFSNAGFSERKWRHRSREKLWVHRLWLFGYTAKCNKSSESYSLDSNEAVSWIFVYNHETESGFNNRGKKKQNGVKVELQNTSRNFQISHIYVRHSYFFLTAEATVVVVVVV